MSQPQSDTQKNAKSSAQWMLENALLTEEKVRAGDYESVQATLDWVFEYASRLRKNLEDLQ